MLLPINLSTLCWASRFRTTSSRESGIPLLIFATFAGDDVDEVTTGPDFLSAGLSGVPDDDDAAAAAAGVGKSLLILTTLLSPTSLTPLLTTFVIITS